MEVLESLRHPRLERDGPLPADHLCRSILRDHDHPLDLDKLRLWLKFTLTAAGESS